MSRERLEQIADAIERMEGYFPGTLSYRNNNPGNLMFVGQLGALRGEGGFARFASYEAGYEALVSQIRRYCERGLTIRSMMEIYAPSGHGDNDPATYAAFIAQAIGASQDAPLNALG